MKILVISNNYPSKKSPSQGVFVYKLIQEFAKLGNEVIIISPSKMGSFESLKRSYDYGPELGKVFRPKFFSASAKKFGSYNTYHISHKGQVNAIQRVVKNNNIEFDVVYAHFITNALIAVDALSEYNKPIFAALGESNIENSESHFKQDYLLRAISKIEGFIAVSNKLKNKIITYGVDPLKITMEPNAVDRDLFYPKDKMKMRKQLGLPMDKKLILFVGRFLEHKGPLRVLEAAKEIPEVGLVFIGQGAQEPKNDIVVFSGKVPSPKVPNYLSAGDIFVLPTQREGSCNAIVEAMACGLPIVSSNIPEVRDQCDPSFSILVDPLDIEQIRRAILEILNNKKKSKEMSENAVHFAGQFDIKERAKRILNFISSNN
jgi:glycosyltransferase involved in cell wall biosynthesis